MACNDLIFWRRLGLLASKQKLRAFHHISFEYTRKISFEKKGIVYCEDKRIVELSRGNNSFFKGQG